MIDFKLYVLVKVQFETVMSQRCKGVIICSTKNTLTTMFYATE